MSWKKGESKLDDLIILNQLNDKTIFIEDNECEILDKDYIKNKKNKISYRHAFSYLPTEIIEKLYEGAMRHYYSTKVIHPRKISYRPYCPNLTPYPECRFLSHKPKRRYDGDPSRPVNFYTILASKCRYSSGDERLQRCMWISKNGKPCKCSASPLAPSMNVLKVKKPYEGGFWDGWDGGRWEKGRPHTDCDDYVYFGVCKTHAKAAQKLTEEERERVARDALKACFGTVEKHGYWCKAAKEPIVCDDV
jgi:hypothetical protein